MTPNTEHTKPFLAPLPLPMEQQSRGVRPRPPSPFVDGQFNFQRGDTMADKGQYADAAQAYLFAAGRFQARTGMDAELLRQWADTLDGSRDLAFFNALACFTAANKRAEGIKALEAAAAKDPKALEAVRKVIKESN